MTMPRSLFNKKKKETNNQGFILGLLIIGLVAYSIFGGGGEATNRNGQVTDDLPNITDKISMDETYIVRVYETSAEKDIWLTKQINNEEFWIKWLSDKGMDFHTLDPIGLEGESNPQAESFVKAAKNRDIEPPFWMHVKQGGTVLSITPFTEAVGEETWKAIIGKSVK